MSTMKLTLYKFEEVVLTQSLSFLSHSNGYKRFVMLNVLLSFIAVSHGK